MKILGLFGVFAVSSCGYRNHLPRVSPMGSHFATVEMKVGENRKVLSPRSLMGFRMVPLLLPEFMLKSSNPAVASIESGRIDGSPARVYARSPSKAVISYAPFADPHSMMTTIRVLPKH
ncbi:MAG: hypothetical protein ACJAVK_000677 [Akkermansiaceae bacterium]|jgi:hypothetical protein